MSSINDIIDNLRILMPELNTSATSIIGRIADVVGTVNDITRLEMLRSEQTIAQATRAARVTSASWYIQKALEYQEGDNLTVINPATQELGYETIDETKQIIKQASIGVTGLGIFFLNVATADSDNNVVQLSQSQLDAFRAYFLNFVAMGAQCSVMSNEVAVFECESLTIRYWNNYNLDTIKQNINTVLHDIQVTRRDDMYLYINEVEAQLQTIDGIRDAYFTGVKMHYGDTYDEPDGGRVIVQPGYFNFDPAIYDFENGGITAFESLNAQWFNG